MGDAPAEEAAGTCEDGVGAAPVPPGTTPTMTKAQAREERRLAAVARRQREAPRRQAFMTGFFNQNLQELTRWHGGRPAHEQRRFLKSVDTLYNEFTKLEDPGASAATAAAAEEAVRAAKAARAAAAAAAAKEEDDPLAGSPREPPAQVLQASASAPSLPSQPIQVFEQRRRDKLRQVPDRCSTPANTLQHWLEDQSNASACTGSTGTTRVSSRLSSSSSSSSRLTGSSGTHSGAGSQVINTGARKGLMKLLHRTALAQAKGPRAHDAGALKDGIPNDSYPDIERMRTNFREDFGAGSLSQQLIPGMYTHLIHQDKHPLVDQFLQTAPPQQREQFGGLVRSLQFLKHHGGAIQAGRDRVNRSTTAEDYNLEENGRLWRPVRSRPFFEPSLANVSRVPLGTLCAVTNDESRMIPPLTTPPTPGKPPPSPAVSDLSSLPLVRPYTAGET